MNRAALKCQKTSGLTTGRRKTASATAHPRAAKTPAARAFTRADASPGGSDHPPGLNTGRADVSGDRLSAEHHFLLLEIGPEDALGGPMRVAIRKAAHEPFFADRATECHKFGNCIKLFIEFLVYDRLRE